MKRLLIAAVALFAAACQPMPAAEANPGQAETAQPVQQTDDATACAARGGKMLAQGRLQTPRCVINYADAGKRCTDGDDCLGDCRIEDVGGAPRGGAAAVGQCQASNNPFGCYTLVEGGKAEATLCVD